MTDSQKHPSRRIAIGQLAAALAATGGAQAQARPNSTPQDFVRLQKELSNWNRWGAQDQMGAVNLITPDKRKAAVRLVREGQSFSMARDAETKEAVRLYNKLVEEETMVGGLFHTTC